MMLVNTLLNNKETIKNTSFVVFNVQQSLESQVFGIVTYYNDTKLYSGSKIAYIFKFYLLNIMVHSTTMIFCLIVIYDASSYI